jgi:hypothetical protein
MENLKFNSAVTGGKQRWVIREQCRVQRYYVVEADCEEDAYSQIWDKEQPLYEVPQDGVSFCMPLAHMRDEFIRTLLYNKLMKAVSQTP